MSLFQNLLDYDTWYNNINTQKVFINDILSNEMMLEDLLMDKIEESSDVLMYPYCKCGKLIGKSNEGILCKSCGFVCEEKFTNLNPILWLKSPSPEYKFCNVTIWIMINNIFHNKFNSSKFDIILYLCGTTLDTKVHSLKDGKKTIKENRLVILNNTIRDCMNGVRTYNNFFNNITNILEYWKPYFKDKVETIDKIIYLINNNKILSDVMPILNSRFIVQEARGKSKVVVLSFSGILTPFIAWNKINKNPTKVEKYFPTVMSKLAGVYVNIFSEYIGSKSGVLRKHMYSGRSHFTMRAVAMSHNDVHDYNEIHLGYPLIVITYKPHLYNKLYKRGYKHKEIVKMLNNVFMFNEVVFECINELIAETPYKGLPCIINRNPSLKQGSSQLVYITKVIPDALTITVSILIAKTMNLDFDGDQLNIIPLLDNKMAEIAKTLEPHFNILPTRMLGQVEKALNIGSSAEIIIANYLLDNSKDDVSNCISNEMETFKPQL